jgi:7-keto-8-aminopelargonate synthetase-like enzyme
MGLFDRLEIDRSVADELSFNPYYLAAEAHRAGLFVLDGRELIDLASNDYLGLATDPRVIRAAREATEEFGASLCGTPIAIGASSGFARLASRLARFVGVEDGVLYPSCYQANTSLLSSLANQRDAILIDHYAHASLVEGARAVGCKIMPFVHNSCDHLEKLLQRAVGFEQVFVVTESVFSTEGAIAPLRRIAGLCERYGAIPFIDDSHGIGVIGETGRGILEHCGLDDYRGIYTASLGKALANSGGLAAGPAELVDYLRYGSPGLIYSTALPPASIGGLEAVLDVVGAEFAGLRRRLDENGAAVRGALIAAGFAVAESEAPIIAVQCGPMRETVSLARELFEGGIIATPFVEPSVPPNKGVLRIIPGAGVGEAARARVVRVIGTIGANGAMGAIGR